MARVHPVATPLPEPSVNNDVPLKYIASANEPSPSPIPCTNAGLHRIRAYPTKARNTQPTSRTKKKKGAAAARTRSRACTVLRRTPIHLHGRHMGWNRIRLRRNRPRAARGMTSVRKTSSSVQRRRRMPAGSAIHRIDLAYLGVGARSLGLRLAARGELVAGSGTLDDASNEPAPTEGEARKHVLTCIAPNLGLRSGSVVRRPLGQTPYFGRHRTAILRLSVLSGKPGQYEAGFPVASGHGSTQGRHIMRPP